MTAIMNRPSGFDVGRQTSAPVREKIIKPATNGVVSAIPAVKIELRVGAELALLLSAPLAVGAAVLAGWVLLTSLGMEVYGREMFGGAIVNVVGGLVAILPMLMLMKKGAAAIAKAAIMGIGIRSGAVLLGVLLAMGPGWHLATMPLVYWVFGCYFPMLIVETGMVAWLCQKAKD